MGTWLVPFREIGGFGPVYGAIGNHATCSLSGFLTQMAIASPLYNGSLSLYYLLTINYNWPDIEIRRIEKWLHILPLGYALLSSSIALGLDMYGNVEWLCWIKPDVPDDHDGVVPTDAQKNFVIFQWVFLFGPLWATILFVALVFIVLYRKVRENEKKMEKYKFSTSCSSSNSSIAAVTAAAATAASPTTARNGHHVSDVAYNGTTTDDNENLAAAVLVEKAEGEGQQVTKPQDEKISSSNRVHDVEGWRALRKSVHMSVAEEDKTKQTNDDDDGNLDHVEAPAPRENPPNSSYHDQDPKRLLLDEDDHDDHDEGDEQEALDISYEEEDEEDDDTKLTLDEEMAIKYAANATVMKQNTDMTTKYAAQESPLVDKTPVAAGREGDVEEELVLSSDGIGRRKSVTFSSTSMAMKKASISSMRSSFHSQVSLPTSDQSSCSQYSIMLGLSQSALNKKKRKCYERASKSRQIAIQGILYSCAFYFTWFFPTLQRITELAANKNYYIIQFLDSVLLPLQGAFNFAIYIRPRFIACRSSNPEAGFWRILGEVTFDNS